MMDNYCAPQWADFTCSPQLPSDSYFEIQHAVHEPLLNFKTHVKPNFSSEHEEGRTQCSSVADSRFRDSLEPVESPQPNMAYFIPHSNRKAPPRESNNDQGLRRTMTNLRLDERSRKVHCTWNISPSGLTSTTLLRDKVEVPERFRKTVRISESKKSTVAGKSVRNNRVSKGVKGETAVQTASTKETSKSIVKSEVDSCSEYTEPEVPRKRSSGGGHRRQSQSFRRSSSGKAPKVLTCQYRRRSLAKYRRCSNNFISTAEAVLKFQNAVPQRFRTISRKDLKPGPLMKLKRSPLKLTQPISPALRCKQRSRPSTILSQEERDALEMKKHQIKANPVPVDILKAPCKLKKVAKKPATITEEFRFAQPKKTPHTGDDKECNSKTVAPIARASSNILQNEQCTEQATGSSAESAKKCLPSSSEARNKLSQKKGEENLKNQQLQEVKKLTEFHAKPAPNFLKPKKPGKEQNVRRSVVPCPFSFAERDKGLAKKKEEHIKELQQQDKKADVFHARPVPHFKPITIQGLSKGNLRSKEKFPTSPKHLATRGTRTYSDLENKQPNISTVKKETKQQDPVKKQCQTSRRTNA